ncbi:MAG TPA: trypsin-like peptidase domain-containing protein [Candidatus Eremiobacteraceae bacterium]|nr:trypsin-like peptidase domain-containing protein [Candidatus Eremiobacteraceae bacterium]
MSTLTNLSDELSAAVAAAGKSTVAVTGGRRRSSSGVVWRDGVVVTADHTLERDDDLAVIDAKGATRDASLAGRDRTTDLAVLRVDTPGASPSARADAASLAVGQLVLAIGRLGPDGIAASMGVMSALDGPWTTWRGGRVDRFVRADLSAYPGFSGGPLVDVRGAVIGINTSGLSRNWSLTVPASTVDRVADALLAGGRIARGYLGVGLQPVRVPEQLARTLQLGKSGGAIVVAVENGSPAERGGLLIGDVLTALDGEAIADVEDIHAELGPERVGRPVTLRVIRAGALADVKVVVGERPHGDE